MKNNKILVISIISLLLVLCSFFVCCGSNEGGPKEKEGEKISVQVIYSENSENDTAIKNFPSPVTIDSGNTITKPANPSLEGYDFLGWYADEECTEEFDFSKAITSTQKSGARVFIYAGWALHINYCDVVFKYNYDGKTDDKVTVEEGKTVTKPADPERDGYKFIMWSTESDNRYAFDFDSAITSNKSIYAIWEKEYKLTYNYGIDSMPAQTQVYISTDKTVALPNPERDGYTFVGWYADNEYKTSFGFGGNISEDTTIYAKWERNSFDVRFNLNFDGAQTATVQTVRKGGAPNRPTNPQRDGYSFDGWFIDEAGSTEYEFTSVEDDIEVYAKWIKLYTITFNANTSEVSNQSQEVRSGDVPEIVSLTRTGYVFGGWFKNTECTEEYSYEPLTADITVYAKWIEEAPEQKKFNVTFDYNYDGAPQAIVQSVTEGATATKPADPERDGYKFASWVVAPTSQTNYRFGAVTEDITIYARWTKLWTVTYDLNYENAPEASTVSVVSGQRVIAPDNPTRGEQWIFRGWAQNSEGTQAFSFSYNILKDTHLYAQWYRTEYNVTWNYNYEGQQNVVNTAKTGGLVSEPVAPVRTGFSIIGWYTDKECTNAYELSSAVNSDLTLYAKWAEGYAFKYSLNYPGAPGIDTVVLHAGEKYPERPVDPVREGYTFKGWSTTINGNPDFDSFGADVTGNVSLYAQWEHIYVFAAEYTDVSDIQGAGWSGGAIGKAIIVQDTESTNAQTETGYFLTYLYATGADVFFEIDSDRDIVASLVLRLSAESDTNNVAGGGTLVLSDEEYLLKVNGEEIRYGGIVIENPNHAMEPGKKPFADVVTVDIKLKKGANRIDLITNNSRSMGGTMSAAAPMVDCIKIKTIAVLTWDPVLDNV